MFSRSVINGVHATGNVKVLNLTSGVYSAGTFIPMVYIAFKLGLPVWSCFVIQAFNSSICSLLEVRALYKQVKFNVFEYFTKVYAHSIAVTFVAAIIPAMVVYLMPMCFLRLVLTTAISIVSTLVCVYTIGINRSMRQKVNQFVINKIHR